MTTALTAAIAFTLLCLALAMIFAAIRLFRGPSAQDRVIALDTLYLCVMLLLIVIGMRVGSQLYFEIALLIALLGFVGSISMAKFLLRGEVIE